jgi:hypothetical protein
MKSLSIGDALVRRLPLPSPSAGNYHLRTQQSDHAPKTTPDNAVNLTRHIGRMQLGHGFSDFVLLLQIIDFIFIFAVRGKHLRQIGWRFLGH